MDVKKIKGIAVVDIAHGEKLGTVDDVRVDTIERRVVAMTLTSGGRIRKDHLVLPYDQISSIGDDAVMVESDEAVTDTLGDGSQSYHSIGSLSKMRVVTDGGTFVGTVTTTHFDPTSGKLTEFEIGSSGLGGIFTSNTLIDADSVISIGEDIIVVPASIVDAGS